MAAEYDHQSLLIGVVYTKRVLAFKTQDAALSSKQHVFKSLTAYKCSAIVWLYIVKLFMCSINWKVNAFCVNRLHWGLFAQNMFLHKKNVRCRAEEYESSTLKTWHYKNVTPKLKAQKKLHNGQQHLASEDLHW